MCFALVLLLLCSCNIQGDSSLNRGRLINSVNHRGYDDAPENTLAAFKMSKQQGFDMVECDVRFTRDNVPVLLHDKYVNRTSNGSGRISDITFEQARQLDFGSWKSTEYVEERIPSFGEFINLCVDLELHPYIEIKNGATPSQVRLLVDIVDNHDFAVTWIARDISYLTELHKLRANDRLGLLVDIISKKSIESLLAIDSNLTFMNANYSFLTRGKINLCQQYSIPLEVWTVDNSDSIANVDCYITGITSNKFNAQDIFNKI